MPKTSVFRVFDFNQKLPKHRKSVLVFLRKFKIQKSPKQKTKRPLLFLQTFRRHPLRMLSAERKGVELEKLKRKMEFVGEQLGKQTNSQCSTLVLPALSIGNVAQLALDLLISSTGADRVGFLDDPHVLPCVGNDAYGPLPQGTLALPLEVYDLVSSNLTFIQQRSPVVKGKMIQFAKNLADFAVATGKTHIIVLSSLDFGRWKRVDTSSGLQIHYLSSSNVNGTDVECESIGWKKLQEYNPAQRRWKYLSNIVEGNDLKEEGSLFDDDLEEEDEDYYASLPFAALYSCFKSRGLKVTCLLCYCSEGDNMPDSFGLAEAACKLLRLTPTSFHGNGDSRWVIPLSWKSVYGPPPDMSLF